MLIQACVNGSRHGGVHPRLPLTPDQVATDARRCAQSGAGGVHVHARDPEGRESLHPRDVAAVCTAVRSAAPQLPISVSTAAWIEPSLDRRLTLIAGWPEPPDLASVNLHEEGSLRIVDLLNEMGVGVEAGVWTEADAHLFVELGLDAACSRVLVEVQGVAAPNDAAELAASIDAILDDGQVMAPRLHHGAERATWAVLDAAMEIGHDVRIGLEDTLVDPDGARLPDNASAVAIVAERAQRSGRMVEHA